MLHGEDSGKLISEGKNVGGPIQEGPGEAPRTGKHGGRLANIMGSSEQLDRVKKLHQLYATQRGKGN